MNRDEWETTHQHFEEGWWGDCANTYGEESKQLAYARGMGLDPGVWRGGDKWPQWNLGGRSVLDIGGGPASMLLKTKCARGLIVDPCSYPAWTDARYAAHGIDVARMPAEDYLATTADKSWSEAWCYNVLQHVIDPEAIVRGMARVARIVRLFEWTETEPYLGHPHSLHAHDLRTWIGGEGMGRELWLDEQYNEIGPESDSPVRQRAFAGWFHV